jgi:hypothetical protein
MIIKEAGASVSDKYYGIEPDYNTFLCETDVYNGPHIEDDFKQMVKFFNNEKYNITNICYEKYEITSGTNIYKLCKQKVNDDGNTIYKCTTIDNCLRQSIFTKDLVLKDGNETNFINDKAYEDLMEYRILCLNIPYKEFVSLYKTDTTEILSYIFKYTALHNFSISDNIRDVLNCVAPNEKINVKLLELISKFAQIETTNLFNKYENLLTIIGQHKELKNYLFKDYKFTFVPKNEG